MRRWPPDVVRSPSTDGEAGGGSLRHLARDEWLFGTLPLPRFDSPTPSVRGQAEPRSARDPARVRLLGDRQSQHPPNAAHRILSAYVNTSEVGACSCNSCARDPSAGRAALRVALNNLPHQLREVI